MRKLALPLSSPETIEGERKKLHETFKKSFDKELIKKKTEFFNSFTIIEDSKELYLVNDKVVYYVTYVSSQHNEGKMARYREWTETHTETVESDFPVSKFIEMREEALIAKFGESAYLWGEREQEWLDHFIKSNKDKAQSFYDRYLELCERSKTTTLTSKRKKEIKFCEEYFMEFGIEFNKWVEPKLDIEMVSTLEEYEVFSEESQDEWVEKVISEIFNMSLDDLDDNWKGENERGSVHVEFGDNYSQKIHLKGDIKIGVMGMGRLKLKEI